MNQGFSAIVGSGSVAPATFVQFMTATVVTSDTIAGYAVQTAVQSTTSPPCGIAQMGTRYAPTNELIASSAGQSAAYSGNPIAGYSGDPIKVYKIGDICQLALGSSVNPGTLLMPDASGNGTGVPASGSFCYGALAQEGGVSGDWIRVQVTMGVY